MINFQLKLRFCMFGHCSHAFVYPAQVGVALYSLWPIIHQSSLFSLSAAFNIVSMGKLSSILRSSSIELNVKVYHRAGKGWADVVSLFVTESTHISLFLMLPFKVYTLEQCHLSVISFLAPTRQLGLNPQYLMRAFLAFVTNTTSSLLQPTLSQQIL